MEEDLARCTGLAKRDVIMWFANKRFKARRANFLQNKKRRRRRSNEPVQSQQAVQLQVQVEQTLSSQQAAAQIQIYLENQPMSSQQQLITLALPAQSEQVCSVETSREEMTMQQRQLQAMQQQALEHNMENNFMQVSLDGTNSRPEDICVAHHQTGRGVLREHQFFPEEPSVQPAAHEGVVHHQCHAESSILRHDDTMLHSSLTQQSLHENRDVASEYAASNQTHIATDQCQQANCIAPETFPGSYATNAQFPFSPSNELEEPPASSDLICLDDDYSILERRYKREEEIILSEAGDWKRKELNGEDERIRKSKEKRKSRQESSQQEQRSKNAKGKRDSCKKCSAMTK